MLLIIGILAVCVVAVIVVRTRVPGGVTGATLGSVSERWLLDHRATHQSWRQW